MLLVGYNCLCAYQLMIQRMRDKLDQVQRELKANCDRERDKLVYRLVHSGQQMRKKVYFYCFCLKIRSYVYMRAVFLHLTTIKQYGMMMVPLYQFGMVLYALLRGKIIFQSRCNARALD